MTIRKSLLAITVFALLFSVGAQAQWVMVARAVSGRIQQMSNKSSNGAGYDVATVVLMANADKVYETALNSLKTNHPEITIDSADAKKREIKFSKGPQIASLQATSLGDKITQLVVASNLTGMQPDATSVVVEGVMRVCKQMNVVCTQENQ
jgi:hypothetical protein